MEDKRHIQTESIPNKSPSSDTETGRALWDESKVPDDEKKKKAKHKTASAHQKKQIINAMLHLVPRL